MDALRQWPHTLNVKRVAYNITQATHKGKYNEHHGLKKHAHAYMLTKNGIQEEIKKYTEKVKKWPGFTDSHGQLWQHQTKEKIQSAK